jgi:hypothetical protein
MNAVVKRAPSEFEGRAILEAIRTETVFGLSGGNLKRLRYCETLWTDWVAEKRKQVRLELLGDEPSCPSALTMEM